MWTKLGYRYGESRSFQWTTQFVTIIILPIETVAIEGTAVTRSVRHESCVSVGAERKFFAILCTVNYYKTTYRLIPSMFTKTLIPTSPFQKYSNSFVTILFLGCVCCNCNVNSVLHQLITHLT